MRSVSLCVSLLALLSACGGGGGSSSEDRIERDINKLQEELAFADRIEGLPGTAFSAMPKSGQASFDGVGGLVIEPENGDPIAVLGDATVVTNFRSGKVTGKVDNLYSARPRELFDVDGEIAIGGRESSIGSGAPNDAMADYEGRLRIDGRGQFDVSGRASGKFRGTRESSAGTADAPRALVLEDSDMRVTGPGGKRMSGLFGVNVEN